MKIMVGGLYHESNTFNPIMTNIDDFIIDEGKEMLNKVASTEVFEQAGVEVITSIYAFGLPSGVVSEDAYRILSDKILKPLKDNSDVDGVWLHLHGSMTVENIGSCELQLLKEIREIIGFKIPISLTLDIHCNNDLELGKYANIIRTYRSVPHIDQKETEKITARLLLDSINDKKLLKPMITRLPMIIGGETAVDNQDPLKAIFKKLEEVENYKGILTVSFCIGFSWADTENTSSSIIVIPESAEYEELALDVTNELVKYIWKRRNEFDFTSIVLSPEDSLKKALSYNEKPVFISDSGDNTTGGGVGSSTYFVEEILKDITMFDEKDKKICVAAVFDEGTFNECSRHTVGERIIVTLGTTSYKLNKPVRLDGVLKSKGDLMGYLGFTDVKVGEVYTISIGNIDIVIANQPYSFITMNHFREANLNIDEYDIIVIKQGYMFDEIKEKSKYHILGLSPGATYQLIEELKYKRIPRPTYPFDTVSTINGYPKTS